MAITSTQHPSFLHSVFEPNFFTFHSGVTSASNFYFLYDVTVNGTSNSFNGRTVALDNVESYIQPSEILKSFSSFLHQPSIQTISTKDGAILKYGIDISQSENTNTLSYSAILGIRSQFNIDFSDYILTDDSSKFLTSWYKHDVYCDTELTISSLNGELDSGSTYVSDFSDAVYTFYEDDEKFLSFRIVNSYNSSAFTDDIEEHVVDIPAGIPNLDGATVYVTGNLNTDGTWYDVPSGDQVTSTISFNSDCEITFNASVHDPASCLCTCIDKDTGDPVICGDSNGGCSNSPTAEVTCYWGSYDSQGTNYPVADYDNFCENDDGVICYDSYFDGTDCRYFIDDSINPNCTRATDMNLVPSFARDSTGVAVSGCSYDYSTSQCLDGSGDPCVGTVLWEPCEAGTGRLIVSLTEAFENYTIQAFDSTTEVSDIYTVTKICGNRFEGVNVAWENEFGGTDYYLFTNADEKTIESSKNVAEFDKYSLSSNEVTPNTFSKTSTVLSNKGTSTWEVQTDWLSQDEIDNMEFLFLTTEVYAKINGSWVYVINATKTAVIYNKRRTGLKKYKINLVVSEKIYR